VPRSSRRQSYHHGDLRKALIVSALHALEREGWEALSIKDLAERAGVARSAPYRHFESRDELLAAVAAEGFGHLIEDIAVAAPDDLPPIRLRAVCDAMLTFAERRPQLFRLMFRSDLLVRAGGVPAALERPAGEAYLRLEEVVISALPDSMVDRVKASTVALWSMVFGFAVLSAEGRIKPFMHSPVDRESLRRQLLDTVAAVIAPHQEQPTPL
jgi:AcrR family transcriptional regulator